MCAAAFLPPDCVELSKDNVDINPEYVDSLDDAVFTVHLLFQAADERAIEKVENREFANTYQLRGKEAFESGLDEVSRIARGVCRVWHIMGRVLSWLLLRRYPSIT